MWVTFSSKETENCVAPIQPESMPGLVGHKMAVRLLIYAGIDVKLENFEYRAAPQYAKSDKMKQVWE